jgi:hypothetical protein
MPDPPGEVSADDVGHRLERHVLVVRALLRLGRGREDRLGQAIALAEATRKPDARDVTRRQIPLPARAGEEPANDGLERDDLDTLDDHRPAPQLGSSTATERRWLGTIRSVSANQKRDSRSGRGPCPGSRSAGSRRRR